MRPNSNIGARGLSEVRSEVKKRTKLARLRPNRAVVEVGPDGHRTSNISVQDTRSAYAERCGEQTSDGRRACEGPNKANSYAASVPFTRP